jgi:hypothetical protein
MPFNFSAIAASRFGELTSASQALHYVADQVSIAVETPEPFSPSAFGQFSVPNSDPRYRVHISVTIVTVCKPQATGKNVPSG